MIKKTKKLVVSKSKKEEVKKLPKIKKTSVKVSKLTQEKQFWDEVDQQSHYLIADILNQILPLPNLRDRKNLDLEKDADYRSLLSDYQDQLADLTPSELKLRLKANHPEPLAESIAYEYFFLVIKSLVGRLREFGCHSEEYLNF